MSQTEHELSTKAPQLADPGAGRITTTASARPEDNDGVFVDRAVCARWLGFHPRTVRRIAERSELPKPCLSAGGRPRWLWSHVVVYCRKRHLREADLDQRKNRPVGERRVITEDEIIEQTGCAHANPYRGCGCEEPAMGSYYIPACPLRREKACSSGHPTEVTS